MLVAYTCCACLFQRESQSLKCDLRDSDTAFKTQTESKFIFYSSDTIAYLYTQDTNISVLLKG